MLKNFSCIILIGVFLFAQGCSTLFQKDKALKEYQRDEAQYQPYKLTNTIEAYKEFIDLYPENTFISDARLQIENLEFDPYEKADSVEGYMEFTIRYPSNRHAVKAGVKIEQAEVKRYEKMDTIEGYREFLAKYPDSTFAVLAKQRLQELEFRQLDSVLAGDYGFDLLRYRLHLKRLKEHLAAGGQADRAGFTCFAALTPFEGKNYFQTYLIYPTDLSHLDPRSPGIHDRFFDPIVSKALAYLDRHITEKGEIDGFSFTVAFSAHSYYGDRKVLLEYYFSASEAHRFVHNEQTKKELFARSQILIPEETPDERVPPASALVPAAGTKPPLEGMDGLKVMAMVSERERGDDYIASSTWKRGRHAMKTIEKRKNLKGKDGFIDKSLLRYIDPPDYYGTTILTWNYRDQEKAYWAIALHGDLGGAPRIISTERMRPPAESDFNLGDYLEVRVDQERHDLLRSEDRDGTPCFVIESTPVSEDLRYGRRINWIDQHNFIPLYIEYRDKEGRPWKTVQIEWQNKFGFLFWKKALVENMQTGDRTFISVDDVRVNVGLDDRDFTRHGLEKQKHGF